MPYVNDTHTSLARTLRAQRNRFVETYVQTVTEILVDGQHRGFVVCDTTRSIELKEEFASDYSLNEPRSREATITVKHSRREAWS